MICQEIIDAARGIIQELDPNNSHVSDSLMLKWIDSCTLQLFTLLNTLPKESVTGIVSAPTITLPSKLIKLDYASIVDTNGKHQRLRTTDFNNFIRLNPGWEDADGGCPILLVRMDDLQWKMFPTPTGDYLGKALTLYGTVNPVTPSIAQSSPPISITMHPCFEHYVSWKAFLVINDPIRAASEYRIFDDMRKLFTKAATSTTGSQQRFTMS